MSDRWLQIRGGSASRIAPEPLHICCGDGQIDT